jgi:RNA recognition motif-containing protein
MFCRYGRVEDVYFPLVKGSDRRRGFCFVRFETRRAAENAAARSSRTIAGKGEGQADPCNLLVCEIRSLMIIELGKFLNLGSFDR